MESNEILIAAKARYEASRRSLALLRATLVLAVVALIALGLSQLEMLRQQVAASSAIALFALVYFATVRGRASFRAVRAGITAGALPLVASLLSEQFGAVCTPAGCGSLCGPVCAVTGCAAALLASRTMVRAQAEVRDWLMAGGAVVATGALGCGCVSYLGVVTLSLVVPASLGAAAVLRPSRAV